MNEVELLEVFIIMWGVILVICISVALYDPKDNPPDDPFDGTH